jgi:hypothetical protein
VVLLSPETSCAVLKVSRAPWSYAVTPARHPARGNILPRTEEELYFLQFKNVKVGIHLRRHTFRVLNGPGIFYSVHAAACRSLPNQHGEVHFRFLPRRVCLARNFNTHAAPCLHGGNYFLLLPRSSCADLDFNSSAAHSLRGSRPHRSTPCRPYVADGC